MANKRGTWWSMGSVMVAMGMVALVRSRVEWNQLGRLLERLLARGKFSTAHVVAKLRHRPGDDARLDHEVFREPGRGDLGRRDELVAQDPEDAGLAIPDAPKLRGDEAPHLIALISAPRKSAFSCS